MSDDANGPVEVVIVGAGPSGLTLANYLGLSGVRTLVVESRPELIDFPRGVGLDDESLRSFQTIGLVHDVIPHTTPNHWLRFVSGRGKVFASIEPQTRPYGWPRRNAFVQPLVDQVLLDGLSQYGNVRVLWSHEAVDIRQDDGGVRLTVQASDGERSEIAAQFLVGCDGGRSTVRKSMDVTWDGKSDPTRWLVVDVHDDPVGTPNAYVIGQWRRPHVSIALPHGIRRFEFMLRDDEPTEMMEDPAKVDRILREVIPSLAGVQKINYIRSRVYTHHARIASSFISGRVMVAGDAAHLMPVWQGQGYNSGIRDSTNLGWKLGMVVQGHADKELLKSYDAERHEHAAAMISISQSAGLLVRQKTWLSAMVRDFATSAMRFIPPLRRYILEMRYKPMPRYVRGVVSESAKDSASAVGTLFPQPSVVYGGESKLLDDVLGLRFAVLMWGQNPRNHMTEQEFKTWQTLGAVFVRVDPTFAQDGNDGESAAADEIAVIDDTRALRDWFDQHNAAIAVVRPDRFVAGASGPGGFSSQSEQILRALHVS